MLNLRYSNLQNEALTAQQRNLLIEGKIDQIPDMSRIVAKQIPSNVKLSIDFTKLARIADSKGKKQLATFLIEQEKSIVKKIPFLLEAQKFESALVSAVKGGDPNIINKVFSAIIAKESEAKAVEYAKRVGDGADRFLKNYAKNRNNYELLKQVSGGFDYSFSLVQLRTAYETTNLHARNDFLR